MYYIYQGRKSAQGRQKIHHHTLSPVFLYHHTASGTTIPYYLLPHHSKLWSCCQVVCITCIMGYGTSGMCSIPYQLAGLRLPCGLPTDAYIVYVWYHTIPYVCVAKSCLFFGSSLIFCDRLSERILSAHLLNSLAKISLHIVVVVVGCSQTKQPVSRKRSLFGTQCGRFGRIAHSLLSFHC